MLLSSLEIKNYRSLEDVKIDNLGHFNVLIGRNNVGKSAIFNALLFLTARIRGSAPAPEKILTAHNLSRSLELRLIFKLKHKEREEFITLLCENIGSTDRYEGLIHSSLLRQVEFFFKAPAGRPELLHLRETKIMVEDNQWAIIQCMTGEEILVNPRSRLVDLVNIMSRAAQEPLSASLFDITSDNGNIDADLETNGPISFSANSKAVNPVIMWPQQQLAQSLSNAFFFTPFRHSKESGDIQETYILERDGINLASVLHTLHNNDRSIFDRVEQFVQTALPDMGILHTPVTGNKTEVGFRSKQGNYLIPLRDMGGGIEQLLMVAVVLFTKGDESTIFLEEPESHLHAGAQRLLIARLHEGDRQVFVTTHSPVFINQSQPKSIYQVSYIEGRTNVVRVKNMDSLGAVLIDIGARNSDLLLSDAVLFVEGAGDRDVLRIWSDALKISLLEHNIAVLPLGGGEYASRTAPPSSNVLTGISEKAPVPHLFLLDRDERRQAEIDKLQQRLGGHIHILERRELENYLLIPRVLLAVIRSKHKDSIAMTGKTDKMLEDQINHLIQTTAESLYGLVLLKRIRVEIGGLLGGLLPREKTTELIAHAQDLNLADILHQTIREQVEHHVTNLDLHAIVQAQRDALDSEWSDPKRRLYLAPGSEIINTVFQHFGSTYKKPEDTVRIARIMHVDEIAPEIKDVLQRVVRL